MTEPFVTVTHDGPVSTLTVNRPDRMNALDTKVLAALAGAIEEVKGRSESHALIVTGAGKAFVAGADIAAMQDMSLEAARKFGETGHAVMRALETLPMPVLAAVNGFALGGGCELALACDFIYASERAKLGQPEVKLGVIPGFGGTQRLSRRVGIAMARELIYTGKMIRADKALRIGLVNAVFAPDELMDKARETAQLMATMGPLAVAAAKRVLLEGADLGLEAANALEVQGFADCFGTADQKEGMAAFLEKRDPKFTAK